MSFLAMKAKAVASTKRREPTTKYTIPIIRFLAPKILRNIELSPSVCLSKAYQIVKLF